MHMGEIQIFVLFALGTLLEVGSLTPPPQPPKMNHVSFQMETCGGGGGLTWRHPSGVHVHLHPGLECELDEVLVQST